MNFAGKMTLDEFYHWLNPEEMPHSVKYNRARLLSDCVEVDDETWDEFLNVLPPIYFTGGFAVCEAVTDDLHLGFFQIEGRRFAAHVSFTDRDHKPKPTAARIAAAIAKEGAPCTP
jgi:hypothetical protein